MKSIHALALGLAFALTGMPVAARQAGVAHAHPPSAPAKPVVAPAPASHAATGKSMSGMECDHEMHEQMMKRMERMEAMMEKMHGAPAGDAAAKPKAKGEAEQHEHD